MSKTIGGFADTETELKERLTAALDGVEDDSGDVERKAEQRCLTRLHDLEWVLTQQLRTLEMAQRIAGLIDHEAVKSVRAQVALLNAAINKLYDENTHDG